MYSITFPVRYYEADPMGVVHHSEYIRYFEVARVQWLHDIGFTDSVCREKHVVFPVVHLELDYKHSARFGENVTVTCEIDGFTGARLSFYQQVLDESGNTCAEGKVVIAFLNTLSNYVMRCPDELAESIRKEQEGSK